MLREGKSAEGSVAGAIATSMHRVVWTPKGISDLYDEAGELIDLLVGTPARLKLMYREAWVQHQANLAMRNKCAHRPQFEAPPEGLDYHIVARVWSPGSCMEEPSTSSPQPLQEGR